MPSLAALLALLWSSVHAGPPVLPEDPPVSVPEPAAPSEPAPTPEAAPEADEAAPEADEAAPEADAAAPEPSSAPDASEAAPEEPPAVDPATAQNGPLERMAVSEPGPAPEASGPPAEAPDRPGRARNRRGSASAWNDRGVTLSFGVGLGGCGEGFCAENPVAIVARGALGYRLPRLAFVGTVAGGGGPRTNLPGAMRMLGIDVGVEVIPTGPGKIEPYLGVALGYMRVTQTSALSEPGQPESDFKIFFSRGGVRATVGLPFRVGPRWSMGPRFDYTWGFAGGLCGADSFGRDCDSVASTLDDIAGSSDEVTLRAVKRSFLPQPWMATFELRAVF
jgi:hypothetical protein